MVPEFPLQAAARTALLLAFALAAAGCATLNDWLPDTLQRPTTAPLPDPSDRPADLIPPEALRVTSTADRQVSLAWNPVLVGDVGGYVITRSDSAQGPFATVGRTNSRFGTVFTDEGEGPGALGDGRTYYYRIHPIDTQDRMSRSHAFASATTDPAPEVPSGLTAYSNLPRRVVLTWEPSEHWTVSGYATYRSPTMAGPWERVASVSGRLRAVYEDRVPGDLRVMYYRITALNRFGGESEMTEPVRAVTKAEPLPPIDVSVELRSLGIVELGWEPNVERDLVSYEIWRSRQQDHGWSEPEQLAAVDVPNTRWTDEAVGCGERLRYQLRAIDADGLVSDFSSALELVTQDLGLRAESRPDGGWRLSWDAERARGWDSARILRERWVLPDQLLAEVSGESAFDLPAELAPPVRLGVILLKNPPADAAPASGSLTAPRCEIALEPEPRALLNPPAASVD